MKQLNYLSPKTLGVKLRLCNSHPLSRWTFTRCYPSSPTERPSSSHATVRAPLPSKKVSSRVRDGTVVPSRADRKQISKGNLFDSSGNLFVSAAELRNACKCRRCVNYSDRQRNYNWADIPSDIEVAEHEVRPDGNIQIRWKNDVPGYEDHLSIYSPSFVAAMSSRKEHHGRSIYDQRRRTTAWANDDFDMDTATIAYEDYMQSADSLHTALDQLHKTGLVFISDVPKSEVSVNRLAERIGALRNTFYGSTWNVTSSPEAKNVAYTSRDLGFHMDLLYMQEPPGLQLLHCLDNTCEGGDSLFVDSFKALDHLIDHHGGDIFDDLASAYITYEYDNDGFYFSDVKPIVTLWGYPHIRRDLTNVKYPELLSQVRRIYWSPMFSAPSVRSRQFLYSVMPYWRQLRAGKAFTDSLQHPGMALKTKLTPGTCAIFDNLRVCHARTAFDTSAGHRKLKGAYVDHQDFHSKLGVLDGDARLARLRSGGSKRTMWKVHELP